MYPNSELESEVYGVPSVLCCKTFCHLESQKLCLSHRLNETSKHVQALEAFYIYCCIIRIISTFALFCCKKKNIGNIFDLYYCLTWNRHMITSFED